VNKRREGGRKGMSEQEEGGREERDE